MRKALSTVLVLTLALALASSFGCAKKKIDSEGLPPGASRAGGGSDEEARLAQERAMRERDLMQSLANTDPLTGLSNRRGLQHALHAALAHCSPQRLVAVYLIDLDGFKPINDAHGHDVGDDLLVAVGHRLQANVRHQTDLVARLGGDEFIIMARDLATPEQAEDLGRSLLRAFEHPLTLSHLRIQVGLTIGYALAPLDSDDAQDRKSVV